MVLFKKTVALLNICSRYFDFELPSPVHYSRERHFSSFGSLLICMSYDLKYYIKG